MSSSASSPHLAARGPLLPWLWPQVLREDDNNWPAPDRVGRQELEIIRGKDHASYTCTKLGSVLQVQNSKDPEGLRIFYYLVQVSAARQLPFVVLPAVSTA